MKWGSAVLVTAGVLWVGAAPGSDALSFLPDAGDANLTFYLDNDLFSGTDESYTNGARLSWISGSRDPNEFGWVQNRLRRLSGDAKSRKLFRRLSGFEDPKELEYNYGMSLTQLMYTPENTEAPRAPRGQRPYAGWLGVDFSLHTKDTEALNSVAVAIGTTGPHSFAKQTQDFVHDVRGQDKFEGWSSQIPNEVTLNLYYVQRRRLPLPEPGTRRFGVDGFTEWRVALGTFNTGLDVGGLLRFGWNLPLSFADPRLLTTSYSHQPFKTDRLQRASWSFYGMTGVRGSLVAFNATLDGPVFKDFNTGTNSRTYVGEVYAGFGARWRRWEFSYAHSYRTKEFRGQDRRQSFGSLAIGYRL